MRHPLLVTALMLIVIGTLAANGQAEPSAPDPTEAATVAARAAAPRLSSQRDAAMCIAAAERAAACSAIEEAFGVYAECVSEGEAERWLAIHEPLALKMPQDAPMFTIESVMDSQQKKFNGMQAAYEVTMEITPIEIEVSGDIAYAVGTYFIDFVPRGDAPENYMDGKFLTVFRKQDDGSWKIWRDSFSSNTPPM